MERAEDGFQRGTLVAGQPEAAREPVVVLVPPGRGGHPRARGLRIVGPGKLEHSYMARVAELESRAARAEAELAAAALVERGTSRCVDRLEADLARARASDAITRQQLNRVLVAFGAAQAEIERLTGRLAAASVALGPVPARQGWRARLAALARRATRRAAPRVGA